MPVFMRYIQAAAVIALILPTAFFIVGFLAPDTVVSDVHADVPATPARVWTLVTNWQQLMSKADAQTGLPKVGERSVVGGGAPAVGKVIRYQMPGGTWDQEITQWQPGAHYAFRNGAAGRGGLMPGDVAMAFTLAPEGPGRTGVDYAMTVTSHGPFNKAVAFLFGKQLGTLRGYQKLILDTLASESVRT